MSKTRKVAKLRKIKTIRKARRAIKSKKTRKARGGYKGGSVNTLPTHNNKLPGMNDANPKDAPTKPKNDTIQSLESANQKQIPTAESIEVVAEEVFTLYRIPMEQSIDTNETKYLDSDAKDESIYQSKNPDEIDFSKQPIIIQKYENFLTKLEKSTSDNINDIKEEFVKIKEEFDETNKKIKEEIDEIDKKNKEKIDEIDKMAITEIETYKRKLAEIETYKQKLAEITQPQTDSQPQTESPPQTKSQPLVSNGSRHPDVLFIEIPDVPDTDPGEQTGGAQKEPITFAKLQTQFNTVGGSIDIESMVNAISEKIVSKNATKTQFSCDVFSVTATAVITSTNTGNSKLLSFIHRGGNNALYYPDSFKGFNRKKHILRIYLHTFNDTDYLNNLLYETVYTILAADKSIGPNIYQYGLMISKRDTTQYYFYSIIERINGCDISTFADKKTMSALPTPTATICDRWNYPKDIILDKFNDIIGKSIEQLKRVGTECGFLMMDSKPENVMYSADSDQVYVIDYDKHMLDALPNTVNTTNATMYGTINVILFLIHTYNYICKNMESGQIDKTIGTAFVQHIFEKLNDEYYTNGEYFIDIRDYIQELYFTNLQFIRVCHHYSYTELGLLRIRYFTEYILSFDQMLLYSNKQVMFFNAVYTQLPPTTSAAQLPPPHNSYKYPIYIEQPNPEKLLIRSVNRRVGGILSKEFEYTNKSNFCKVYSLNRLCIMNNYIPFDYLDLTNPYDNVQHTNSVLCGTQYNEHIKNVLVPEFKKALYLNLANVHAYIKEKVDMVFTTPEKINEEKAMDLITELEGKLQQVIDNPEPGDDTTNQQDYINKVQQWIRNGIIQTQVINIVYQINKETSEYSEKLIEAFKQNVLNQKKNIDENIKTILYTKKYIVADDETFIDVKDDLCSHHYSTILQLDEIIKRKKPNVLEPNPA